ncbi:MAG: undecaprenyl-diphosphate phosphatase [Firmicutes bacterium]|nr:undecaprenyl-diphosphate phosphatase [Bacillota bacterium]
MGTFEGIILGIIQGLTEFLPVSSSGHLVIFQELLGISATGVTFEVMVHFATLLSVLFVFGHDIIRLAKNALHRNQERHFLLMLLLGIIPTGLMGVLLGDFFSKLYDSPLITGFMLLVTGCILFTLYRIKPGQKNEETMTALDALLISVAQGIAIIPGISRSGSTITAAIWRGLNRETAVRFSFLVSIPVILGATVLELKELPAVGFTMFSGGMLAGMVAAFISGIVAIRFFIKLLAAGRFHYFAYYCWFVGLLVVCSHYLF